jgi:glycerol uptake operon antiterminator
MEFLARLAAHPCCAATATDEGLDRALRSRTEVIVILRANGLDLAPAIRRIHEHDKLAVAHLDLVSGLRADGEAVDWLAASGADAVISSRGHLMPAIRRAGIVAIQRLLLVHQSQVAIGVASIKRSSPHIVEVLPGVILPQIRHLLPDLGVPLLAGGFIRTASDVRAILDSGAIAVTSSAEEVWNMAP